MMKHSNEFVKGMAIGMIRCGRTMRYVARELNVSHVTVRSWWIRWCREGNIARKEGSGLPGERYAACCITEHDRFGGGSVMIWTGIWHVGRTVAVVIKQSLDNKGYLSDIVTPIVIPTVN